MPGGFSSAAASDRYSWQPVPQIAAEANDDPDVIRTAPHARPVGRLDEVRAVKTPVVRYAFEQPAGVAAPKEA